MILKLYSFADMETHEVNCDFCSYSHTFDDVFHWADLMEQMKKAGWKIEKDGDDWTHKCPACQGL